MGRELSTEPMHQGIRTSWHGAAATTGGERRLRVLRRERSHRMVTRLVEGSAGRGDWGVRLKPFWAANWWVRPSYKYPF
jgi:hypothetical protein